MDKLEDKLFRELTDFQIGSNNDSLTFVGRLCRENNWSQSYAARCVNEYKKFIYLAVVSGESVTPSDQVDQVWHLHLTYTESYWQDLCHTILKRAIHHGPTRGGAEESKKYRNQYQTTLEKYTTVFGENPPSDIWPECEKRFEQVDKFVRLNTSQYLLLKKPSKALFVLLVFPFFLAACTTQETTDIFLWGFVFAVVFYTGYLLFKLVGQNKKGDSSSGGCGYGGSGGSAGDDKGGDSGCGSGCGGCGG